jgi:hypothetical protein
MCKVILWKRVALSIGAPLGKQERGLYSGDFERLMKEDSRRGAPLSEELYEGNLDGGLL